MKGKLQTLAHIFTGVSIALLVGVFFYLKHTYWTLNVFSRTGIFAFLWAEGALLLVAILLGVASAMQPTGRKLPPLVAAALSLTALLFVVFFLSPACRMAFPERMPPASWQDPAADFKEAIRRGDHRNIVIPCDLGSLQPGWDHHVRVFPKVIVTEWDLQAMPTNEAWALFTRATNYASAYNRLLQAHLQQRK